MKGRTSVMIGIRVSDSVNTILKGMADKKGITVSELIKGKVEEYARLTNEPVNTNKPSISQRGYIEDKGEFVIIGGVKYRKQQNKSRTT